MLKMIHRLKSGMFPALFLLTSASALAQPLIIPPYHWQEGMAVGGDGIQRQAICSGGFWQWQPRSVRMGAPDAVQAGLTTGKSGMVSESRTGQDFYILGGHTASLTTAHPGLQHVGDIASGDTVIPRIAARGELARGQVRYGEITFTMHHLLAWQDNTTYRSGLERGQRRCDAGGRKAGETPVMAGERL
ncbi:hypothetical protein O5552_07115 [Escherichia coli]|nr:hypothetical protein [Escherichia coli]